MWHGDRLTYTAVSEAEALRRCSQDLGVEMHQEGTNGVLVRLGDTLPQLMLPLHNLIPFSLGFMTAAGTQPVS